MKKLLPLVALVAVAIVGYALPAQSAMSTSMLGVGPHGWDYYIGTWSCRNSMPSAMSGPASQTLTISRSNAGPALFFRVSGRGFDQSGYVTYSARTKTWSNPASYADGSYSYESSTQTGKTTVWTGSYFSAASGATMPIRDTYTILSQASYADVSQMRSGGAWKTTYKGTCTRS